MSSAPSPWERIGEIDGVHDRGKKDQEVPVMRAAAELGPFMGSADPMNFGKCNRISLLLQVNINDSSL